MAGCPKAIDQRKTLMEQVHKTPSEKKPYSPPAMASYGSIRSLTQSTGMGTLNDSSNPGNDTKSM
jgi:hypothetical protein